MTSADFAAAQQRIAARRQQRLAAEQTRALQQQQQLVSASQLTRLPHPLRELTVSFFTSCASAVSRDGTNPTFRVGQVDAELLDEDLLVLLKGQVGEALKYYGSHLRDDWDAEILLALRSILFKLTIWDNNASYGAALQNLQYTDARNPAPTPTPPQPWQKALYGLFSVGGRYAWQKWEAYLLDVEAAYDYEPSARLRFMSRLSTLASTTHSFAAFASFLVFLLNGKYRTILDRLLRLRLMPSTNQVSRQVSFEYLNRQLVWHAFTEFLLFLLPLVGISRWRRWLSRVWRKSKSLLSFHRHGDGDGDGDEESAKHGELSFLPERTCAICYKDQNPASASEAEITAMSAASGGGGGVIGSAQTDITNPYECLPCGCIYCFVCLAQRLEGEEGEGWVCLRCGEIVKECRPWSGDVVVAEKKPRKRVSFMDADAPPDEKSQPTGRRLSSEGFEELEPSPVDDDGHLSHSIPKANGINGPSVDAKPLDESAEWAKVDVDPAQDLDSSAHDEQDLASLAMLDGGANDNGQEEYEQQ